MAKQERLFGGPLDGLMVSVPANVKGVEVTEAGETEVPKTAGRSKRHLYLRAKDGRLRHAKSTADGTASAK